MKDIASTETPKLDRGNRIAEAAIYTINSGISSCFFGLTTMDAELIVERTLLHPDGPMKT